MPRVLLPAILTIAFLLAGCTKEEADFRLPYFNIPVIEGFYVKNQYGQLVDMVGQPNIKIMDGTSLQNSRFRINTFPNPCTGRLYCSTGSSQSTIKKIWITAAQAGDEIQNLMITAGSVSMYDGGKPLFQIETDNNNLSINIENFETGFYRLYVKMDDCILYDNIVIIKSENRYE